MAYLINRNVSGRLPCLHGICQYLLAQFGQGKFSIRDLKYDEGKEFNIHDFSPCRLELNNSNYVSCRYLDNPLSPARCALVQSVEYDPQKSKLASDIMNALDALALVSRQGRYSKLTDLGINFSEEKERYSANWESIATKAVLSYGPFVGMLHTAQTQADAEGFFSRSSLENLGYPRTIENIFINGENVLLSTGSQRDTTTRTRSVLLSFALSTGLISSPDIEDRHAYVMGRRWNANQFKLNTAKNKLVGRMVSRPLSYNNLTKNTRSLRERGQQSVREATVSFEDKIKNRRVAAIYALSKASESRKKVDFDKLCELLSQHENTFIINKNNFKDIMSNEIKIANIAGVPYITNDDLIKPLCHVDYSILLNGIPSAVNEKLELIVKERSFYEV